MGNANAFDKALFMGDNDRLKQSGGQKNLQVLARSTMSNEQNVQALKTGMKATTGCIGIGCGLPLLIGTVSLLWGALFGPGEPKVQVLATRVVPFTNAATGAPTGKIQVDWKNVGNGTARQVNASMTAYDASGNVVYSVSDYTIYASSTGVAPNQTYLEVGDEGHVVLIAPNTPLATTATATITKVKSEFSPE